MLNRRACGRGFERVPWLHLLLGLGVCFWMEVGRRWLVVGASWLVMLFTGVEGKSLGGAKAGVELGGVIGRGEKTSGALVGRSCLTCDVWCGMAVLPEVGWDKRL